MSRQAKRRAPAGPTLFEFDEPAPVAAPPTPEPEGGLVEVALNRPLGSELTYLVPRELDGAVVPGVRVAVPLGRRREVGVVVGRPATVDFSRRRLRPIHDVLDPAPVVGADLLELARWMAERTACSWGEALAAILPAPLKRERGARKVLFVRANEGVGQTELESLEAKHDKQHRLLRTLIELAGSIELREVLRQLQLSESPARTLERRGWITIEADEARPGFESGGAADRPRPESLLPDQQLALARIEAALVAHEHKTFLLEGVTGSGKTEVYLSAIERSIALGRAAVVLVPEIALTPQTVGWFRARFAEVAVIHSRMTDVQRFDAWRRIRSGDVQVVVGARSAIFAPFERLGVVVVDEEHEPSFKQGSVPRYHARDVAIERARRHGAVCILGSATPSMETYRAARGRGPIEHLRLPNRVSSAAPPIVQVVDLRNERDARGGPPLFSRILKEQLVATRGRGEQAILFLNRRGFVPVLWCPACKSTVSCADCDVSMTWHRGISRLVCHACCDERPRPAACPTCSNPRLAPFGFGSERVESALRDLDPGARVARMDSDTMRRQEDYVETLEAFGRGDVDVLVGTQMIAKGLDFPRVTLVGVLSADQGLWMPDFRAAERTYQLIAQVSGRAGRADLAGTVVIQTFRPEHPAVALAATGRFHEFALAELAEREELGYPPFGRLIRVLIEDEDEARVRAKGLELVEALRGELDPTSGVALLGPSPAPLARLRRRFRYHILVKAPDGAEPGFRTARRFLRRSVAGTGRPRVTIDVDPVAML
ncbi:MAG: primosomal protein N' [Planctomycetota bacterium]